MGVVAWKLMLLLESVEINNILEVHVLLFICIYMYKVKERKKEILSCDYRTKLYINKMSSSSPNTIFQLNNEK